MKTEDVKRVYSKIFRLQCWGNVSNNLYCHIRKEAGCVDMESCTANCKRIARWKARVWRERLAYGKDR